MEPSVCGRISAAERGWRFSAVQAGDSSSDDSDDDGDDGDDGRRTITAYCARGQSFL
jgi:hypothetical protein